MFWVTFTHASKGYSRVLRQPWISSYWSAPATRRLRTIMRLSTCSFQSAEELFSTEWIFVISSSSERPENIVTFFTFSYAAWKYSSSTAPAAAADPAENAYFD